MELLANRLEVFFEIVGARFIAVGDYNAISIYLLVWGSRLANPKDRALHKTIINK